MTPSIRRWLSPIKLSALTLALTMQPLSAAQQGRLIDSGVFTVSRDSDVVGREEFNIHQGHPSTTGVGFVGNGYTVSATAYYPHHRSYATASSVIQLAADSQPTNVRMDLAGTGQPNVFVDFAPRRITVRNRTASGESAGQYPRSPRMLVVDDAVLCTFAMLPGTAPGSVTLFYPRTGRRDLATLEDHGTEATRLSGGERQLRHWTIGAGDAVRHLWYDSRGHLQKFEMPSARLIAIRAPGR